MNKETLNLDSLADRLDVEIKIENLGLISIRGLNLNNSVKLNQSIREISSELNQSPEEKIDIILPFYLFQEMNGTKSPLTREHYAKISSQDKEEIIKAILKKRKTLSHETIRKKEVTSDGTKISFDYGGLKYPQDSAESLFDYFYRLHKLKAEEEKDHFEGIRKHLSFSSNLNKQISDLFKGFRPPSIITPQPISFESTHNLIIPKNHTLETLQELSEQINEMNNNSEESIKINIQMLNELKSSSDQAKVSLRINIFFTILAIAVTFYGIYISNKSSDSSVEKIVQPLKEIGQELKSRDEKTNQINEHLILLLNNKKQQKK